MSVSWDIVHKLLNIADLANKWPRLRAVHDAALRELEGHAETAAKDNAEALKKKAEEEATAKAKRDKEAAELAAKEEAKAKEQAALAEKALTKPRPVFPETTEEKPILRRPIEEPSNVA